MPSLDEHNPLNQSSRIKAFYYTNEAEGKLISQISIKDY